MKLCNHPGYFGAFTKAQAKGAIPNGTTIMKRRSEPEDATPDGTIGIVLGSIDGGSEMAEKTGARFMYWVEWSDKPKVAIAAADVKIERAS